MTKELGIEEIIWANGTILKPRDNCRLVWSTNPLWINEYLKNDKGEDIVIAQHNTRHIASIKFKYAT